MNPQITTKFKTSYLHSLPIAAVTNYHKLSVLKHHNLFYHSRGQKSEWVSLRQNQGVNRAVFLLETLRETPCLCLFQLLEATHTPGLMVPSSTSKASSISHVLLMTPFLWFSLWPPSSTYRDPCDDRGPTQINQGNLPSQAATEQTQFHLQCSLPLPCNLTYSQLPGTGSWTSLEGPLFCPPNPFSLTPVPPKHSMTYPRGTIALLSGIRFRSHQNPARYCKKWPWEGPRCGPRPTDADADRPSQLSRASARASVVLPPPLPLHPNTASGGTCGWDLPGDRKQPCPGPSRDRRGRCREENRRTTGRGCDYESEVLLSVANVWEPELL